MRFAQETLFSRISVAAASSILCVSFAFYFIAGSCTSRKTPTEPTVEIPRVMAVLTKDGTIWTVAIPDGAIHMYQPILPGAVSLAVAPNGDALYIRSQDSIIRFSFADQTRQTIYRFPISDSGFIRIVGAGTQLFVGGLNTRIIDLSDHTVRHKFGKRSYDVVEYAGSSRLLVIADTSWHMNSQTGDTSAVAPKMSKYYFLGWPIAPSPDPDKIFLSYVFRQCLSSIVRYDTKRDVLDTFLDLYPGVAGFTATQMNGRLFYSHAFPWSFIGDENCHGNEGPSYRIFEMDPLTFATIDTIIVGDSLLPQNTNANYDIFHLSASGDGRTIVGMPPFYVGFVIIDTEGMNVIRRIPTLGNSSPISRSVN